MTRDEIENLIPLIPWDADILYKIPGAWQEFLDVTGQSRTMLQRRGWLLMNPAFGWEFALSFAKKKQPVANAEKELETLIWLQEVNDFQRGHFNYNSPICWDILDAAVLKSKNWAGSKDIVDGLLLVEKHTYAEIGEKIGMTGSSIRMYEQLFWNVRDRFKEKNYIAFLTYPQGRKVELNPNYLYEVDQRDMMLRQGISQRPEMVMRQAGAADPFSGNSADDYVLKNEACLMAAALAEFTLGGGHGMYPGIAAALRVIASMKQSGQEQKNIHEKELSDMSVHHPVMATLKQLTDPALNRMLALEQLGKEASLLTNVGETLEQEKKTDKNIKGGIKEPRENRQVGKPDKNWAEF